MITCLKKVGISLIALTLLAGCAEQEQEKEETVIDNRWVYKQTKAQHPNVLKRCTKEADKVIENAKEALADPNNKTAWGIPHYVNADPNFEFTQNGNNVDVKMTCHLSNPTFYNDVFKKDYTLKISKQ